MLRLEEMNMDQELRDSKLIRPEWVMKHGGSYVGYMGGIMHFEDMDYDTLQWMVDNRFADPDKYQNDAPAIKDFLIFLKSRPNFRAIGHVVDKDRDNYRLSVEGVTGIELSDTDQLEFALFARQADEFDLDAETRTCRAWWD